MARRELSMRKLGEIFRLSMILGKTNREIARSLSISHTVVNEYLKRAAEAGLNYPTIQEMDEGRLGELLKADKSEVTNGIRPQPDWAKLYEESKKKSVTLQLLWQEYKEAYPEGYQLSQFYEYFNRWKRKLDTSLRQNHKAGEKCFVDYAGQTIPVMEPESGQKREAEIFVAVLGASNYTFSEATLDQSLASWIGAHIHAFEYFGGVPEIVVPDNLKSGISKACRYEPDLNPAYHDMALHYGTAVIPARVAKPRDKAKVEVGVQIVERWILAALRNHTFFGIHQLNEAIRRLLEKLNIRPFKKMEGSRKSWFEKIERQALKPLPSSRYVLAEWKKARVNIDYHVELEDHYYSAPYSLVHEEVEIRWTQTTVEIFFKGKRVASHLRDLRPYRHTTHREHMPKSHQQYLEWSPSRILQWAGSIGEHTEKLARTILESRPHPEQGYRSCLGILRLGKAYGKDRLEAASRRAILIGASSYKSIRSILENGLDQKSLQISKGSGSPLLHGNLRGQEYYQ